MKSLVFTILVATASVCVAATLPGQPELTAEQMALKLDLLEKAAQNPGIEFFQNEDNLRGMGYDPKANPSVIEDAFLRTPDLIRKYGYPAEVHSVQTSDDYILEMHRIPGSPSSPPAYGKRVVYLQHGLLDSSAGWVIMGPHHGLGYWLADLGYDVWLGNARGNRYSRQHISNNPDGWFGDRRRFWTFSWDQIGRIDLPAMIDYITSQTGQQRMHYIGHSQGTTAFFVMGSLRPEYNDRIVSMNALAPVAYMSNLRSPGVRAAALFMNTIDLATSMMGIYEFLPDSELMTVFGYLACRDGAWFQEVCANILFVIGGFNSPQLNYTMLPVILGHTPAGAATDQVIHYGQGVRSGYFRRFDFGLIDNLFEYGSFSPPNYPIAQVRAPVALHYSLNDYLAEPIDVQQLHRGLGNVQMAHVVSDASFNHFDFLWGIDAPSLVYSQVLTFMRRFE